MSDEPDAYAVLHVEPGTPAEVISLTYRTLARRFHPDGPTPDPERMTAVNRAYNEIKTEDLRRRYDARRALVPVGPGRRVTTMEAGTANHDLWASDVAPYSLRSMLARAQPADRVLDIEPYKGWRIAEVARIDPEYLRWLSRHSSGARFRREIARCLPDDREVGWSSKALG